MAGAVSRGVEFLSGQGAVVGFPFGDGSEPGPDPQGPPGGGGHPCRDADAFGGGCFDDLGVHVGIDGDGELGGRVTARHAPNYTTTVRPLADLPSGRSCVARAPLDRSDSTPAVRRSFWCSGWRPGRQDASRSAGVAHGDLGAGQQPVAVRPRSQAALTGPPGAARARRADAARAAFIACADAPAEFLNAHAVAAPAGADHRTTRPGRPALIRDHRAAVGCRVPRPGMTP